ncbi:MAG: universal stress protein [Bacteroidetes bacterium]|nr:universal stress protein [Bacteroidota bacterium]
MKTTKITKVLIALDYDPTAQKVAEGGYIVARSMDAEVVLLHVVSDLIYYSSEEYSPIMGFNGIQGLVPLTADNGEALKEATLQYLAKSKIHLQDDAIQTIVEEGAVAETILKVAKEIHANFIVMGSHSRKWLKNILIGSVTEEVLRHSKIPIFVIPTKKHD